MFVVYCLDIFHDFEIIIVFDKLQFKYVDIIY